MAAASVQQYNNIANNVLQPTGPATGNGPSVKHNDDEPIRSFGTARTVMVLAPFAQQAAGAYNKVPMAPSPVFQMASLRAFVEFAARRLQAKIDGLTNHDTAAYKAACHSQEQLRKENEVLKQQMRSLENSNVSMLRVLEQEAEGFDMERQTTQIGVNKLRTELDSLKQERNELFRQHTILSDATQNHTKALKAAEVEIAELRLRCGTLEAEMVSRGEGASNMNAIGSDGRQRRKSLGHTMSLGKEAERSSFWNGYKVRAKPT